MKISVTSRNIVIAEIDLHFPGRILAPMCGRLRCGAIFLTQYSTCVTVAVSDAAADAAVTWALPWLPLPSGRSELASHLVCLGIQKKSSSSVDVSTVASGCDL